MVNSLSIQYPQPGVCRLVFASSLSTPTFRIYRYGVLVGSTRKTFFDVVLTDGTVPVFEVLDQDETPDKGYPAQAVIQWIGTSASASYLVEQYVDGSWTTLATYTETGRGYYQHTTQTLADGTQHQFRVTPISPAGNAGTASTVNVFMVRYPDPPNVTFARSGGTVTITQITL